jgi:hypothetical protein
VTTPPNLDAGPHFLEVSPVTPPVLPTTAVPDLGAGALISRSFSVWRQNLWPFAGVSLAIQVPSLLLTWALGSPLMRGGNPFARPTPEVAQFTFGWRYWLVVLGTSLLSLVQMGALTAGAIQHLAGHRASPGAMLGAGLRRAWPILVAGVLGLLAIYLGLILLVIPGLIVSLMFSLTVPVVMAEGLGPVRSLGRSRALTKGHRWSLLGLFFVAYLVVGAPALLAAVLAGGVPYVGLVLNLALGALLGPLVMVAPAVAYHEVRVATEGADTAALARVFE